MLRRGVARRLALVLALGAVVRPAFGQAPTNPTIPSPYVPGSTQSRMGAPPGSGAVPFGNSPGDGADVLGGRPGVGVPRVPTTITTPGTGYVAPRAGAIAAPTVLPVDNQPLYGSLALPTSPEDEGPPHGLTLDMAIERLVRENLDLRSRFFEIPQARADILTASLRANPFLYWDSQLIPYGQYSNRRTGGPLQYDLNITQPLDLSRKRQARTFVATRAQRVLEAQYQNAVRVEIDTLYRAFIDVLAARETVRLRQTSVVGLKNLLRVTRELLKTGPAQGGTVTSADVLNVELNFETAELALASDEEALRRAKRLLTALLNYAPADADQLEIRGTLYDRALAAPTGDALIQIAFEERSDLRAYRLGVQRAEADVRLARANRFQDVYLLYQPYTFQNNEPFGGKSATSWAIGMTIPLPVFNRNQGNIQRASLNVTQTQIELDGVVRQAITDVQNAEREYLISRDAVERIEQKMLRPAAKMRADKYTLFTGGEVDVVAYFNTERAYNDIVALYISTLIRHRRAMLSLNTVLGKRLLP